MPRAYPWYRPVPLLLAMGGIFVLSHLPGETLTLPDLALIDKAAHLGVYTALGGAALYALPSARNRERQGQAALFVLLLCFLYGLSDEWHQSFVPGRCSSAGDVLADVLGGFLSLCGYRAGRVAMAAR